ncbi:MAG TPA: hypothetical protein IAA60_08680 [Candidatus Ornithomonoglobus intestinigallinarum]|uniref:Uncharacterized protein n=1 Tax=Candidatus Ornithomonoglobus intestinigallinarum TaxID=2840894 RepID=A0A9D1H483_9FIRM|nr:hypothetical protein [Candidatus Ornithomonoglobus intestinigallinarum]
MKQIITDILITASDRDKEMGEYDGFKDAAGYDLVNDLSDRVNVAAEKYGGAEFDYGAALAPHAEKHCKEFGAVKLDLNADEADRALSNEELIQKQKAHKNELLPVYEYMQCFGNRRIPLAEDIKELLSETGNTYNMAGKSGDGADDGTVYNLRNTLELTDERADEIIENGYFDLQNDILYPLLTKTANFWTGLLTPEYLVVE